ncbi:Hsp20/alpha crystallin family protein [Bacteroides pyogenes]|uniref:Uncharacterized protein n=2 Tax=Bacteroides pyogenes TaxID=310300 RepID=W4PE20_9BACE|nr:Hsp20/alpha crystallin family protein [Bacteroides pyogenes]GAE14257.1 hypothetical protein JCM6292_369 [Bacteroides pyogenes JCM 6292]GAE18022.1 hypothetical protein JCM6294_858 [Bacteroides pyogenes DSM 20611 = JCM 6294]
MKLYKYLSISCIMLFSFGIAGCSDENEKERKEIASPLPELKIKEDPIKVKIGTDNKVSIDILEGGGEYNVFSTNEDVVTAEIIDNKVSLEGKAIGEAALVLSDKNSKYLKFPVSVYLTDKIKFSQEEVEMKILAGHRKLIKVNISEGNGGYKAESDNRDIKVNVTGEGEITIEAIAKEESFSGSVTIKDKAGFTASLPVKVAVTTNPFPEEFLAEIKADSKRRYFFDGESKDRDNSTPVRKLEDGQYSYGWTYYSIYSLQISFKGDLSVGKKTEAIYAYSMYYNPTEEAVDLEIIQNDGENIWAIFSYKKDGVIHYGYFCDKTIDKELIKLKLETNMVTISGKKGEPKSVEVKILSGSGNYEAYSDYDGIEVTESNGVLLITGIPQEEEIEATVAVEDKENNQEEEITVILKASEEGAAEKAFSLDEKIMSDDKERLVIDGSSISVSDMEVIQSPKQLGFKQRSPRKGIVFMELEDKEVGEKSNIRIYVYGLDPYSSLITTTAKSFKVLKNSDGKIWATFIYTSKDGKERKGYICCGA